MNFKLLIVLLSFAALVTLQSNAGAATFVPIDYPGASHTFANSIEGSTVAGTYYVGGASTPSHGFIFDGSNYTTLDHPLGVGGTRLTGISGSMLVGSYFDSANMRHGFVYDGVNFAPIEMPSSTPGTTRPNAIDGNTIVGEYVDTANVRRGFIFDGSSYTTVASSLSPNDTYLYGVSGTSIVGGGWGDGPEGFLYDGSTFTPIGPPGNLGSMFLGGGIEGSTIVGDYYSSIENRYRGFIYDGSTYTTLEDPSPLATGTFLKDISGNRIVGYYATSGNFDTDVHGFVAVVPEPSTLVSAILGIGLLLMGICRSRWQQRQHF